MQWKDDFTLGISSIDAQHKELFNLLNLLQSGIKRGDSQSVYATTIRALVAYTQQHFADEEAFMQSVGYPKAAGHKKIHDQLLSDTRNILIQLKNGQPIQPISLLRFLNEWVCKHILDEDLAIGRYTLSVQRKQVSAKTPSGPLGKEGETVAARLQSLAKQREHKAITSDNYSAACHTIFSNDFTGIDFSDIKELEKVLSFIDDITIRAVITQEDSVIFKRLLVKRSLDSDILSRFKATESKLRFLCNLRDNDLLAEDEVAVFKAVLQKPVVPK